MNEEKKRMINDLIKLANELDRRGLMKEADYLDGVVNRIIKLSHGELIDFEEEKRKRTEGQIPKGEELGAYLIVLDDGETYSDTASVVKVNVNELEDIWAGTKVSDVVPEDHSEENPKWVDIDPEDVLRGTQNEQPEE
ncbi:hypothetical protein CMI47_15160 [Candidatus Pacearchaeota archaeon]|jgi:hypothetical protein|nr:hypothetical protein [Candidatus Pacearchaeota archaeon]|tara:strand:- start:40 stop:453 length:414 start_codon:yes stop_codon:yes gene_type:complete